MHLAFKIILAVFIAVDIAVAAFYMGVIYATPTDTIQVSEDGTTYTGGIIKNRTSDTITIETAQGEQVFTLTPQTTIEIIQTGDITAKNIKVGAAASVVAKGSELISLTARQPAPTSPSVDQ